MLLFICQNKIGRRSLIYSTRLFIFKNCVGKKPKIWTANATWRWKKKDGANNPSKELTTTEKEKPVLLVAKYPGGLVFLILPDSKNFFVLCWTVRFVPKVFLLECRKMRPSSKICPPKFLNIFLDSFRLTVICNRANLSARDGWKSSKVFNVVFDCFFRLATISIFTQTLQMWSTSIKWGFTQVSTKTTFTGKPSRPPRTFSQRYQDATHMLPAIMVLGLFANKKK